MPTPEPGSGAKPTVFLDRDGTIIVDKHYLRDPAQVEMERGALEGLVRLQTAGHPLIVVSNQSGIGRGKFTESDALRVNARVDELLRQGGVNILAWYICPHAPDEPCECRKPLPGMALQAQREWGVALRGSYVIGDKKIDLELADAIGGTGLLVTTGHGLEDEPWARAHQRPVFDTLSAAAAHIIQHESRRATS